MRLGLRAIGGGGPRVADVTIGLGCEVDAVCQGDILRRSSNVRPRAGPAEDEAPPTTGTTQRVFGLVMPAPTVVPLTISFEGDAGRALTGALDFRTSDIRRPLAVASSGPSSSPLDSFA